MKYLSNVNKGFGINRAWSGKEKSHTDIQPSKLKQPTTKMYIIRCLFVALLVAMASARNHQQDEKASPMCHCQYFPGVEFGFLGTGTVCPKYAMICGMTGNVPCCFTTF